MSGEILVDETVVDSMGSIFEQLLFEAVDSRYDGILEPERKSAVGYECVGCCESGRKGLQAAPGEGYPAVGGDLWVGGLVRQVG